MPSPPSFRRCLLAAGVAMVTATLAGADPMGPRGGFILSQGVLIMVGGYIASRVGPGRDSGVAVGVLSLMTLIPALNVWFGELAVGVFDMGYHQADFAIRGACMQGAKVVREAGPFVLASAVATAIFAGRGGIAFAGASLGSALGGHGARWLMEASGNALLAKDMDHAALWSGLSEGVGLCAALGAGLLWWGFSRARPARLEALILVLHVVMAGMLATPPLRSLLAALPETATAVAVPRGEQGAVYALDSIDADEDLDAGITRSGYGPLRQHQARPCIPKPDPSWGRSRRPSAALARPADEASAALMTLRPELARHGIFRVVLVGRTEGLGGPLGSRLSWPGAPLMLDFPPIGSRWVDLGPEGWTIEDGDSPSCALALDPRSSIDQLYTALRELNAGPCSDGIAWVVDAVPNGPRPALGCAP